MSEGKENPAPPGSPQRIVRGHARTTIRAGAMLLAASASLLGAAPALAADTAFQPPPKWDIPAAQPRARIAAPADMQPITDLKGRAFFHDVTLGLEQGWGQVKSRDDDVPGKTDFRDTTLTLGFRAGSRFFGALSGSYMDSSNDAQNAPRFGSIPISGNGYTTSFRASGGYMVLPFWAVGASFGNSDISGGYQYQIPVPRTGTDGHGFTQSYFTTLSLPAAGWMFSGSLAYTNTDQKQDYANNFPPGQDSRFEILTATVGASRRLGGNWHLRGSLAFNHTLHQSTLEEINGLDQNWATLTAGLSYRVNRSLEIGARVSTWLDNDKNDYTHGIVGVTYHF